VIAHVGNVPVEEWLPFLVPVVALYVYGRHRERRRRALERSLPRAGEPLEEGTARLVLAHWSAADHSDLGPEHVALFCPPGPEGLTASELARRLGQDPAKVQRLLEQLEELDYLELEQRDVGERRAWLTLRGYDLLVLAETSLASRG
jgi:DNA-binding MarR family transcriptional regulator